MIMYVYMAVHYHVALGAIGTLMEYRLLARTRGKFREDADGGHRELKMLIAAAIQEELL